MLICTASGANHLPKVACLEKSLTETQPQHQFLLCLVERDRSAVNAFGDGFSNVVVASELGIPNFDLFIFQQRSRYEACCAVKAQLLLWALKNFPQENYFLYLDPDIRAYSRFDELDPMLGESHLILTPHHLNRDCSFQNLWDDVARTLPCGIFNAGFLALRRSAITVEFLEWWNQKLQILCIGDASRGLYFDQKWLDLALSFFDIDILREPGYNVAHWNIYERRPTLCSKTGAVLVDGKPLRCFHFSMVDSGRDMLYFKKYLDDDNPVFSIRAEYVRDTSTIDSIGVHRLGWSYESFVSGEQICPTVRSLFRSGTGIVKVFSEPFLSSNAEILAQVGRSSRRT